MCRRGARRCAAIRRSLALARKASAREQALIRALAARYARSAPEDRVSLDLKYASAMRGVVQRYPQDMEAATLYAEALMDLSPWNYWMPGGQAAR